MTKGRACDIYLNTSVRVCFLRKLKLPQLLTCGKCGARVRHLQLHLKRSHKIGDRAARKEIKESAFAHELVSDYWIVAVCRRPIMAATSVPTLTVTGGGGVMQPMWCLSKIAGVRGLFLYLKGRPMHNFRQNIDQVRSWSYGVISSTVASCNFGPLFGFVSITQYFFLVTE